MEGILVKFHMQKRYKEEGHKCVEVAMVEEPPTLFFLNSFRHKIVVAWCLRF